MDEQGLMGAYKYPWNIISVASKKYFYETPKDPMY